MESLRNSELRFFTFSCYMYRVGQKVNPVFLFYGVDNNKYVTTMVVLLLF